ncbi:protease modulator HflC [Salinisphaera hydrothermalis]|uniref:Protein HflC n=1 Tax=Salinisphaera hydrothermalis (strain C41B8) TaxID=1304275 RepID=A0A084ILV4_SALHC|nr:protease modulator HflC [Salinisphaera hydrothermalis]KEZ77688.1 HflC protein [Salinisphaera hydrothermalis C41B8]
MSGKQIFALIVVLIAAYVAYDSMFVVTPRERVVVVQMGEIVGSQYQPGLHFKIPFVQKVHRFDRRVMTLTGEIDRVLTSENKNLSVDYYVKWQIADPVKYYLSTHGNADRARTLLTESVQNDLLAEFSKRTIRQAVGDDRNEIVAAVQVQVNEAAKQLGIDVKDVRIMKLDLPSKVSDTVYERMRSERQEVIRTLRAQGDAAAKEIRSDAERERTVVLAKAYKEAEMIRGQGDAKAAEVYANAYKKDPKFYSFYRSLQLYRQSIGDNDVLLLKPDGQLFKYFNPGLAAGAGSTK